MTKRAYIWIVALIVAAYSFNVYEDNQRDDAIAAATTSSVRFAYLKDCEDRNEIKYEIRRFVLSVSDRHSPAALAQAFPYEPCEVNAQRAVDQYLAVAP